MTELIWEDPPGGRGRTGDSRWWEPVLPKLMERPGYWACVRRFEGESAKQSSNAGSRMRRQIESGKFPEGGTWEVRTAIVDGVGKVFVRFTTE